MSYLVNDPVDFREEMIEGLVAANASFVRRVDGGVARASRTKPGRVALVIGGGSGHYPAFAGLVGQGLAHGAVMGNVFASPSTQQVYAVAKEVASHAGVLLSYGNYAGDVLNFDEAQERLRVAGIPCRTVTVTDDIDSASTDERAKRRGIAGDLVVFRAAAWAAEQGRTLDEVWELANRANDRTRTLGVAFSGCTLPGADRPLFEVPADQMAVGMGIHGEPGIEENQPLPTAAELAAMLVQRVLAERPDSAGDRVAVILNGLGAVKYEELFVTYRTVAALLQEAGLMIVAPEVGEMVTSFEMAGVSLTLTWLDDELEQAWLSPVSTPAYRRGVVEAADNEQFETAISPTEVSVVAPASEQSRAAAAGVVAALRAIRGVIDEQADELGRLDAIAGDGDHGIGMQRGATAALAAAEKAHAAGAGAGGTLAAAAAAWSDRAGGTSGSLWGTGLRTLADRLGDEDAPDRGALSAGVHAAAQSVQTAGKAQLGDKTMLDALLPFADVLGREVAAGVRGADAWAHAAAEATKSAEATAQLAPRVGRARPHVNKSLGTPDPGAVSLALVVTAVGSVLEAQKGDSSGR